MLYLYLSDDEIAVVQTSKNLVGKEKIISSSRKQIPAEIIIDGLIRNPDKLTAELNDILQSGYPKGIKDKEVTLTILDNQVFTHRLNLLTSDKSTKLSALVIEEAKKAIPVDITQLVNFYRPINTTSSASEIFYTALPKSTVLSFAKFLKDNSLKLHFLTAKSQAIFQLFKSLLGENDIWLYSDFDKEKVEYYLFDQFGLIYYIAEKLGSKSIAAKAKSLLESVQKEKGETVTKLIIGGIGSIDLLISEMTDTIKTPTAKMGEIIEEVIRAANIEIDCGGVPKVLFACPLGLMLLSKTASPANFAADLDDFIKEEVLPVSIQTEKEVVPEEVAKEVLKEVEEKGVKEKEAVSLVDSAQMMPSQIVEYKKISLGQIFANKIFLIIASIAAGFIVISGLFLRFGQKGNITLPFMVSPSPIPSPTLVPTLTPTPTIDSKLKRGDLTVSVQNGTDKAGFAKENAIFLEEKGYKNIVKSNADRDNYEKTIIKIKKDKEKYLPLVVQDLSGKFDTPTLETLEESSQYDVIIVLGGK